MPGQQQTASLLEADESKQRKARPSDTSVTHPDQVDDNANDVQNPSTGNPTGTATSGTKSEKDGGDKGVDTQAGNPKPREFTRTELDMLQELDMLFAVCADAGDDILLLCPHFRRAGANRSLNTHLETRRSIEHLTGLISPLSMVDQRHISSYRIAMATHVPRQKVVCIGLPELTRAEIMSNWLEDWKKLLKPRGILTVQLQWESNDRTWRDAARRYADMAHLQGFKLEMVNGCDVGRLGECRSYITDRARIVSNYGNLAAGLGTLPGDPHTKLRHLLEKRAEEKLKPRELVKYGAELYGTFVLRGSI
ncbi:Nn.00g007390.m01.CDS01 [Neocucurbitaria sp. VM-36]